MKILYVSDGYNYAVHGTKRALREEIENRGFEVVYFDVNELSQNRLLSVAQREGCDHIWIVHTFVTTLGNSLFEFNRAGIYVHGFGMSDPTEWDEKKLQNFNSYSTNSYEVFSRYSGVLPTHYWPTACETKFHRPLRQKKQVDLLFYGTGQHPAHQPPDYRNQMVRKLKVLLPEVSMNVHGINWDADIGAKPELSGDDLIEAICKSRVGIDLSLQGAPVPRRIFEMAACETPVVAGLTTELCQLLSPGREIITYRRIEDLAETIMWLLSNERLRQDIAEEQCRVVRTLHNITNRVDSLLKFLTHYCPNLKLS